MFLCCFRYLNHSYRADFSNFAPFLPKVSRREALMGIINQLLTNITNSNYDYHGDVRGSEVWQKGDTSAVIQTMTVESYDASKKDL